MSPWYRVVLTDDMMKPTRAHGLVEADDEDHARERAEEHVGDGWHDRVIRCSELGEDLPDGKSVEEARETGGLPNTVVPLEGEEQ